MVTNFNELMQLIHHTKDIYSDYLFNLEPEDIQGWHSQHHIFKELIELVKPRVIIEVGSWKGASVIHMCEHTQSPIICVDTFLGEEAFWIEDQWRPHLKFKGGRPTIYNTFMSNVIRQKRHNQIIPLSLSTITAARYLKKLGIKADLIYVDASHEAGDVYRDLEFYWELLETGGVLFGDDYMGHFQGLIDDVNKFVQDKHLELHVTNVKWWARKV